MLSLKYLYISFLPVILFSCDFKSDEEKINESYDTYRKGILQENEKLATSKLHSNTFDYFDEILFSIKEDDSTDLLQLPVYDRLIVLMSRHLFDVDVIYNLTGETLLQLLIKDEFVEKESVMNNSLGEITVFEDFAKVEILVDKEPTMFYYDFYYVDGEWLFDFTPICNLANEMISYSIEDSDMEENDYLISIISQQSTELIGSTIWTPIELR